MPLKSTLRCLQVIYLTKPYAHRPVDNEGTSFYLGSDILLGIPPATRPPKTVNLALWDWLEDCWNIDPSQRPEVRTLAIWLCFPEWIEQEDYDVPPAEYYKALRPQV